MPVGSLKNTLYALALPVLGRRCGWKCEKKNEIARVLHKHHAAGAAVQEFRNGKLTRCHTVGYASDGRLVTAETVFRTASVAKMITALLVFRLQTKGLLSVQDDLSDLLGYSVRNPAFPDTPITLGMALSHTSSIVDCPAYFASFEHPVPLRTLLESREAFMDAKPGERFRYSNLAAGLIGCVLERKFGMSLDALARCELFEPLDVQASFDMSALNPETVADSWRVLPPALGFDADKRIAAARPAQEPDPEYHYLLASGSLFLTAEGLAKLTLAAWNGADGFLSCECVAQMRKPLLGWPDQTVKMRHGMGLLELDDPSVCGRILWGHQGFAYGAVNGVFFDEQGNGFVCLNSGASEQRTGHLACLNRDLIKLLLKEK